MFLLEKKVLKVQLTFYNFKSLRQSRSLVNSNIVVVGRMVNLMFIFLNCKMSNYSMLKDFETVEITNLSVFF